MAQKLLRLLVLLGESRLRGGWPLLDDEKRRLDGVRERVLCGELALNKAGKLEIIELG